MKTKIPPNFYLKLRGLFYNNIDWSYYIELKVRLEFFATYHITPLPIIP